MDMVTTLPTEAEWRLMQSQSQSLLASGFLAQGLRTPEQVIVIMLKGRELGIAPMQALSHIHVINGKPCMSAELMLALILRVHPKTKLKWVTRSAECAELQVTRYGWEPSTFKWTIKDAATAQLLNNPSWKKYPRAMLHARVISEMARSVFPDAIAGCSYTPEEMGANVDVDDTGQVVVVETVTQPEQKQVESKPQTTNTERFAEYLKYGAKYGIGEDVIRSFVGNRDPEDLDEDTMQMVRGFIKDQAEENLRRSDEAKAAFGGGNECG